MAINQENEGKRKESPIRMGKAKVAASEALRVLKILLTEAVFVAQLIQGFVCLGACFCF